MKKLAVSVAALGTLALALAGLTFARPSGHPQQVTRVWVTFKIDSYYSEPSGQSHIYWNCTRAKFGTMYRIAERFDFFPHFDGSDACTRFWATIRVEFLKKLRLDPAVARVEPAPWRLGSRIPGPPPPTP